MHFPIFPTALEESEFWLFGFLQFLQFLATLHNFLQFRQRPCLRLCIKVTAEKHPFQAFFLLSLAVTVYNANYIPSRSSTITTTIVDITTS